MTRKKRMTRSSSPHKAPHRPHKRPEKSHRHDMGAKASFAQGLRDRDGSPAPSALKNWLWGRHPVKAALANAKRPKKQLWATEDAIQELRPILNDLPNLAIHQCTKEELRDKFGDSSPIQGMALEVGPLPTIFLEDVLQTLPEKASLLMLDQVTDPHNVGAILRSAAAFGISAVICQDRHSPDDSAVLAKSASGALDIVPLVHVPNLTHCLDLLKDYGFWSIGLAEQGATPLHNCPRYDRQIIVLGSEGDGMRRLIREHCDLLVHLPTKAEMSSLNVSNAAAVTLYHFLTPSEEIQK